MWFTIYFSAHYKEKHHPDATRPSSLRGGDDVTATDGECVPVSDLWISGLYGALGGQFSIVAR